MHFTEPREPNESCVGSSGAAHGLELLSLEIHIKTQEDSKTSKDIFLSGFSKELAVVVVVCSCHFALFRKFVGFASNILQHHAF